jgi:hypothetical protein
MATTRAWRSRRRSCPASDGFDITQMAIESRSRGRNLVPPRTGQIRAVESLVVVIRNQIELGHHHVRYGVRAPMRTTAAITISPKATDARRVITLAAGLMVSSIETGWGSPNLGKQLRTLDLVTHDVNSPNLGASKCLFTVDDVGESIDHRQKRQAQSAGASGTQFPERVGLAGPIQTRPVGNMCLGPERGTDHTSIPLESWRICGSRQAPLTSKSVDDVGEVRGTTDHRHVPRIEIDDLCLSEVPDHLVLNLEANAGITQETYVRARNGLSQSRQIRCFR